jgi:uncharacterized membrane protein YbhN (UPF0104 family)
MKRTKEVSTPMAFASLAYIRTLDVLFTFILFGLNILFIGNVSGVTVQYKNIGTAFFIIIASISFGLLYYSVIIRSSLGKLSGNISQSFFLKKWIDYVIKILDIICSYRSSRIFLVSNVLTFFIWSLILAFYYLLALSIGISLSFFEFSICVLLINFTGLLPIQGVAGFGTFEGAVIIGLTSFGVPLSNAIAFSISLHILYIIYFMLFGIAGYMFINKG